mmetsp:Transcript_13948/g.30646  ORF Transcript_13948/g.30646 Transcript_13948/m.30646 type:complete len:85 (+) Transcript_13948:1078-1332(+)
MHAAAVGSLNDLSDLPHGSRGASALMKVERHTSRIGSFLPEKVGAMDTLSMLRKRGIGDNLQKGKIRQELLDNRWDPVLRAQNT